MSIFDAAVHSGMHDDMRRNVLALIARVTTIEDALQIKPTEPTSTPERCHIGGCVNPLPPYIFPFCAKCGLPTCTAHVYEHPAPLEDDADNTAGWCKTCHDTPTIPAQREPVQRAYVVIADECGVTECTTRVTPDESNQCNHCGKPTCWAHKNHPDVMYCDNCWNGMRDTPTQPARPDDGPSICYICGIDHDIEDVAECVHCHRTVCFDHSVNVIVSIERFFKERVCKACHYDEQQQELNDIKDERDYFWGANQELVILNDELRVAISKEEEWQHRYNSANSNAAFFIKLYFQQSAHLASVQKQREQARLVTTLQAITIKQLEQQIRFAQSHLTVLDVILSPSTQINVDISESEEE